MGRLSQVSRLDKQHRERACVRACVRASLRSYETALLHIATSITVYWQAMVMLILFVFRSQCRGGKFAQLLHYAIAGTRNGHSPLGRRGKQRVSRCHQSQGSCARRVHHSSQSIRTTGTRLFWTTTPSGCWPNSPVSVAQSTSYVTRDNLHAIDEFRDWFAGYRSHVSTNCFHSRRSSRRTLPTLGRPRHPKTVRKILLQQGFVNWNEREES